MYTDDTYGAPDIHQQEQHNDDINANHVGIRLTVNCQICQELFSSNNALHRHLQLTCQASKQSKNPKKVKLATVLYAKPKKEVVIASTAPKTNNLPRYGFQFRGW